MSKPSKPTSRRQFLISIGTGGAVTAAAVVAAVAPQTEAPAASSANQDADGYQVSEHINKYYRTTRV